MKNSRGDVTIAQIALVLTTFGNHAWSSTRLPRGPAELAHDTAHPARDPAAHGTIHATVALPPLFFVLGRRVRLPIIRLELLLMRGLRLATVLGARQFVRLVDVFGPVLPLVVLFLFLRLLLLLGLDFREVFLAVGITRVARLLRRAAEQALYPRAERHRRNLVPGAEVVARLARSGRERGVGCARVSGAWGRGLRAAGRGGWRAKRGWEFGQFLVMSAAAEDAEDEVGEIARAASCSSCCGSGVAALGYWIWWALRRACFGNKEASHPSYGYVAPPGRIVR